MKQQLLALIGQNVTITRDQAASLKPDGVGFGLYGKLEQVDDEWEVIVGENSWRHFGVNFTLERVEEVKGNEIFLT